MNQQIYSLPPLAAREPLQKKSNARFCIKYHTLSTLKQIKPRFYTLYNGARSRNRTNDLLITNQLLCQLSYAGAIHGAKMGAGF